MNCKTEKYCFKPFNYEHDRVLCSDFLRDTHSISEIIPENPDEDTDSYLQSIRTRQRRDVNFCSILYRNNQPIGLVDVFPLLNDPETGFVLFYYLIKEMRGNKLGNRLEDYSMKLFKRYGCTKAKLEVSSKNSNAIKFYKNHGWEIKYEKHKDPVMYIMEKSLV